MKIVLLGYMASGKSSIGKKLAHILEIPFIDLDDYISNNEGQSISGIFANKGEIYFRKKETIYLTELLSHSKPLVLAVGGGTPCYGNNMAIIKENALSFYLKGALKTIYTKLSKPENKKKRPLIAEIDNKDLMEFIAKHLFERASFYEDANNIITIEDKTKKEIAKEISLKMQS